MDLNKNFIKYIKYIEKKQKKNNEKKIAVSFFVKINKNIFFVLIISSHHDECI